MIPSNRSEKARWDYINNKLQIALELGDPGPFWRYIRSQKQDNVGISPLKDGGKLHTDSMEKAEILSNQFKSVFTQEDTTVIPHLHGPYYPTMSILEVTSIGVTKLLTVSTQRKHKALTKYHAGYLENLIMNLHRL